MCYLKGVQLKVSTLLAQAIANTSACLLLHIWLTAAIYREFLLLSRIFSSPIFMLDSEAIVLRWTLFTTELELYTPYAPV